MEDYWESEDYKEWLRLAKRDYHGNKPFDFNYNEVELFLKNEKSKFYPFRLKNKSEPASLKNLPTD